MMMKKILYTIRTWLLLLLQIILPVSFVLISIILANTLKTNENPKLDFSFSPYDDPITVVSTSDVNNVYYIEYLKMFQSNELKVIIWNDSDMVANMINETRRIETTVRMRYIIGSSFFTESNSIVAWFNNEPLHSPPLSLQYAINAILRQKMGSSDYMILFSNYPLPPSPDTRLLDLQKGNVISFQMAIYLGFSMAFVSSFYILFSVKDRVIQSKHLQFVSGVGTIMYWLTAYLWDFITFSFTSAIVVVTIMCFQAEGFRTSSELGRLFLLLLVFAFAVLPEMYLASFLFEVPSTGYIRMTLVNVFFGTAAFMIWRVLAVESLDLKRVAEIYDWIHLCIPHYALSAGIFEMSNKALLIKLCDTTGKIFEDQFRDATGSKLQINFGCEHIPSCCDLERDFFAFANQGIGRHLCFLFCFGILLTIILLIGERCIRRIRCASKRSLPMSNEQEDADVLEEKSKVRNGEIGIIDHAIVLEDLTKVYKRMVVVNELCLGIKSHECFGLLGVNGAGKTTTFKMMTGDVRISKGDIWIFGWNTKTDIKHIRRHIGYCPQFDALIYELTGKETLIMYCLLRGFTWKDSKTIADMLSKEFGFHTHINKRIKHYSGGTKRKLSAAISIVGDPPAIFLDEPTTGMDPVSKRKVWNALCRIRDAGKCLVLTSHSMEECEALCTRLAIMVNGVFKCLGTTQHLKNKFSQGYTLTIKIKRPELREIDSSDFEAVEQYVRSNFPNTQLRERYQDLVTFYINDKRLKWSVMFGLMEHAKRTLNIEDYSIGQCSLEQVFLYFTKFQRSY